MATEEVTTRPRYVEYGGRATAPGDFECLGGHFRALVLEGDKETIAELVDKVYNDPAPGTLRYRVLSKYVLMQFGWFDSVRALTSPFDGWGTVEEKQVSIWVPLAEGYEESDRFRATRIVMAVPFIFVDNPMSYAGGRETYGYPKSMGQFAFEDGVRGTMSVDTYGGPLGYDNKAGWHRIITVSRAEPAPGEGETTLGDERDFINAMSDDALERPQETVGPGEIELSDEVRETALGGNSHQLFLKQFRDVGDPTGACYQEVVEADIEMTNTSGRAQADKWHVDIKEFGSHPIGDELGVRSQDTRVTAAIEMEFICKRGSRVPTDRP